MGNKKKKLIYDKTQKTLLITGPITLFLIAVFTALPFILREFTEGKRLLISILVILDVIVILLFFLHVGVLIYKYITNKTIIRENEYNLHRSTLFYNYDTFARKINIKSRMLANHNCYVIAFKPTRSSSNSSYISDAEAEINGFVADYLKATIEEGKTINKRISTYCYTRGIFLIFIYSDTIDINNVILKVENRIYQIEKEHDFRVFVQPHFGVAEYDKTSKDDFSIYELTAEAMEAREIAEKDFETVLYYSPSMHAKSNQEDIDELNRAIDNGEFVVYYQPKFNLSAKRFTSSEALIRWNSPTKGLLSPYKFIQTAEHSGLIHKLDMFVLEQVCKDLAETRRKGRRLLPVSINFSIYEFYGNNFVNNVIEVIEKYHVSPSLIEIEVTESTTGVNQFLSISILKKLREYGLRILMDDFGIGYSNFNNLRNMPIDVLKIDKSFVDNIVNDVKSREIAKFITSLGLQIGLEVIAEGVDNIKQVEILKKFRCSTIQGFYFSKPLNKTDYEKFLANNEFEKGAR